MLEDKLDSLSKKKAKLLKENAELNKNKSLAEKKLSKLQGIRNDVDYHHILEVDKTQREYNLIQSKLSELKVKFSDINKQILELRSV